MHEGMLLGNTFINSLNEKEKDYREYNVAKYDSEILTGAEVINVTRKYQNDMEITVVTGNGSRIFTKNNNFNISANYPENDFYIEPYDDYVGWVGRDVNGKINRLKFELRRG